MQEKILINKLKDTIQKFQPKCEKYKKILREKEAANSYKLISRVLDFFQTLQEIEINNHNDLFINYQSDIIDFIEVSNSIINDSYLQRSINVRSSLNSFAKSLENGLIKQFENYKNQDERKKIQSTDSLEELVEIYRDVFRKAQKETEAYKEATENIINELEEKKNNELKLIDDRKEEIEKISNLAKNAKEAFTEEHKLHSAKKYWANKAKRHNNSALWGFSTFIGLVMIIIIAIILNQDNMISYDTNQTIINSISTSENSTQTGNLLLNYLPYLFIFSLVIWMSRIILKVTFSHLHLQEEAKEKETMILTYLALINEGGGLEENDRKLVLEAIFRPSTNGLIKDESNVTLLDIANIFKGK